MQGDTDVENHETGWFLLRSALTQRQISTPFLSLSVYKMGALSLIFLKLERDLDWHQPTPPSKEKLCIHPVAPTEHWTMAAIFVPGTGTPSQSGLSRQPMASESLHVVW